ncbi:MAG TPA: hypothetical protein VFW96_28625 [Thermomicrobiales bacterium]|nr:hypothetical protein [Thermomicrobiales bacterium]
MGGRAGDGRGWRGWGRPWQAGLALALLVAALVAVAWSAGRGPTPTTLGALHDQTERYTGREVRVTGTVRAFTDATGRYYVLEDAARNRALLRGDPGTLAGAVGRRYTVVGVVGFDPKTGITLDVRRLTPAGAGPTPSPAALSGAATGRGAPTPNSWTRAT